MIIATIGELNAQPTGTIVYDRDLEMYRKRADGRWAYPANNPTLSSIAPNGMMGYGPLQTLDKITSAPEIVVEINGLSELDELPVGSVVMGKEVARKGVRWGGDTVWAIAGNAREWSTKYFTSRDPFPLRLLYRAPE